MVGEIIPLLLNYPYPMDAVDSVVIVNRIRYR